MSGSNNAAARVRGLGSAKAGTHVWWTQRLTAAALVLLVAWFAVSLILNAQGNHAQVRAWIASPVSMVMLILTVLTGLWHAVLGLVEVIEDYVHAEGTKLGLIVAIKFFAALLAVASVVAVFRIAFGG